MKNPFKAIGKRFFGTPDTGSFTMSHLGAAPSREGAALLGEYQRITYAAISLIAEEVAGANQTITRAGSDKQLDTHDFLRLLKNPNPDMTGYELREVTDSFYSLLGEVFWYFALGENSNKPKEIYVIRPDRVKVMLDDDGSVSGYKVERDGKEPLLLQAYEVLHIKNFNPNNPYRGYGTLEAAFPYVDTEGLATRFTRNFIHNNATPAGVLSLRENVSKEIYDRFKRAWREGMSGATSAGKVAIVRNMDMKFEKIGLSLGDIDLKALKELSQDDILKMFRVPKALLGDGEQSGLGRSNVETLEYSFSKRTIEPRLRKLDDHLQKAIDRFYPAEKLVIGHESVIPADKQFQLEQSMAGVDKWMTRDEVREIQGEDPIGAVSLYTALNQTPIEGLKNPSKGKTFKIKAAKKEVVKEVVKKELKWDIDNKGEDTPQERFRLTVEDIIEQHIPATEAVFKKHLDAQLKTILDKLSEKSVTAKDFEENLFDEAEDTKKLAQLMAPIALKIAKESGIVTYDLLDQPIEDVVYEISIDLEKRIKEHTLKMSKDFNKTTVDKLARTMAEGYAAGEGNSKIAKRVESVYSDAKGYRAKRIARSENHWTALNATQDAYKQSGVTYKQWYANPGACQFCASFDGKVVALESSFHEKGVPVEGVDGGTFNPDYETVQNTHLHPNCKCQLLPLTSPEPIQTSYTPTTQTTKHTCDCENHLEDRVNELEEEHIELLGEVDERLKEMEKATNKLNEVLSDEQQEKNNQS